MDKQFRRLFFLALLGILAGSTLTGLAVRQTFQNQLLQQLKNDIAVHAAYNVPLAGNQMIALSIGPVTAPDALASLARLAADGHSGSSRIQINGQNYQAVYQPTVDGSGIALATTDTPLSAISGLWLTISAVLSFIIIGICISIYHLLRPLEEHLRKESLQHRFTWEHVGGIALRLTRQQRVLDANPRFFECFDLPVGSLLSAIQHDDEKERIQCYLSQALDSQQLVDFECSFSDRFGEQGRWAIRVRPWQQNDQQYLLLTGEDISKRYFMENQLREEQQRLSTYLETMQTLLIICDGNGRVQLINQQALQLLQQTEQQVIGFPLSFLVPRILAEEIALNLSNLGQRHLASMAAEFPLQASNGQARTISWRITRLGNSAEVLLAGLDITEAVANREALENANQRIRDALTQAEEANQSKTVFLANMSHEIRTPLNGIIAAAESIADTAINEEQRFNFEIIQDSSETLLEILNDILDLSKIESGNLELETISFDLYQLLAEIHKLFKPQAAAKKLSLLYYYAGNLPRWWQGDPKRLRQIITNLAGNALKFTEEGRIEIRVEGEYLEHRRYQLHIAVHDTGIGISSQQSKQIFSAFRQADSSTSRRYGGTGLGLTICRHLAEAMQGDIRLQSEQGQGSIFTVSLPMEEAIEPASAETLHTKAVSQQLRGHVLLAEDNEVNIKVAVKMLERLGLKCSIAQNGQEAVDMVSQQPFDLVLMDVNMPVLDGIEATRKIRELPEEMGDLPILALTANAMMEDKRRCLESGMNGFISKPMRMETVRQAILEAAPTLAQQ